MKIEKEMTIVNKLGLHARAATQLVQLTNQFDAEVTLEQGDKQAPANSVLALMMLESSQGKQIKITSEGKDAELAMQAVEKLIADGFNESE
jgi:phosphocarrier protein NPr